MPDPGPEHFHCSRCKCNKTKAEFNTKWVNGEPRRAKTCLECRTGSTQRRLTKEDLAVADPSRLGRYTVKRGRGWRTSQDRGVPQFAEFEAGFRMPLDLDIETAPKPSAMRRAILGPAGERRGGENEGEGRRWWFESKCVELMTSSFAEPKGARAIPGPNGEYEFDETFLEDMQCDREHLNRPMTKHRKVSTSLEEFSPVKPKPWATGEDVPDKDTGRSHRGRARVHALQFALRTELLACDTPKKFWDFVRKRTDPRPKPAKVTVCFKSFWGRKMADVVLIDIILGKIPDWVEGN
ncbi:hypothetical protein C8R46DRAFT_1027877 [Mycena filopes]|nr:hypothetical protein C8R46DRAFT_1027877 [Mycena filopes]